MTQFALLDPSKTPNVVTQIATIDTTNGQPISDPGTLVFVDLTNVTPTPDVDWTYDPTTQTFTEPVPVANRAALLSKATTALSNNQTYLGITGPTNAQVVAQVQALTRQMDALIRLVAKLLDSTGGT